MARHNALVMIFILAMNTPTYAQLNKNEPGVNEVSFKAFSYFEQIQNRQYDDFLRSIRPSELAPELRAKIVGMLRKEDLVNPNGEALAKLKSLDAVLKYHQRDSVIEIKVLRVGETATAAFLACAAVLVTERALNLLTAEELQAVVAHELGHEYYWTRFEDARQKNHYSEVQELDLRCDGIALITLQHLGVNPSNLISGISKLHRNNNQPNSPHYIAFNERVEFIQRMIELVSSR